MRQEKKQDIIFFYGGNINGTSVLDFLREKTEIFCLKYWYLLRIMPLMIVGGLATLFR